MTRLNLGKISNLHQIPQNSYKRQFYTEKETKCLKFITMSVKAAVIASLIYDLQESYKMQSLSEKGQIDLNKTINEMYILSIIYQKCSQENREIIDKEMLRFQVKLRQEMKNAGGLLKWMGWTEVQVINLDDFWPEICKINEPECQYLIEDIRQLKSIK